MQYVFALDQNRKPLDPCHPARARHLLDSGKAVVLRRFPFTVMVIGRMQEDSTVHEHRLKIDPGSKVTGFALVRECDNKVVWACELQHRGQLIVDALQSRRAIRRGRRNRNCRYRQPRCLNRRQPKGWLPPSIESRLSNMGTWCAKIGRFTPLTAFSLENVKFDLQLMENPEISGVAYQQGEWVGYEVKAYLLEKFGHTCAYCGISGVRLEIEHIVPKSRGGSNRVSNLVVACEPCNRSKNDQTAEEFGFPDIQKRAKSPLKDASAVNAMRWELWRRLSVWGLPVECGTGGRTKFNRTQQELPKEHWLDAACGGKTGENIEVTPDLSPIYIKAHGHSSRQMCRMDKFGFPRTSKAVYGFQTGDLIVAKVTAGKKVGSYTGRVAIRITGYFDIQCSKHKVTGINWKYCKPVHKNDGYSYNFAKPEVVGIPPLG